MNRNRPINKYRLEKIQTIQRKANGNKNKGKKQQQKANYNYNYNHYNKSRRTISNVYNFNLDLCPILQQN